MLGRREEEGETNSSELIHVSVFAVPLDNRDHVMHC